MQGLFGFKKIFPDIDINGGAIDGTVIGGASPAAGTFTTLTATTMIVPSILDGYTTTATAAGTTTLTVSSNYHQFFTGSTTQTVKMPVTSTLTLGQDWRIVNNSSGVVTVTSSGDNTIVAMVAGSECILTCILISGTTAASWDVKYGGIGSVTGTGSMVLATSPALTMYKTIYIPAAAMAPTTTNGATAGSYEYTTQDIMYDYLAFDGATEQFACFAVAAPEDWNLGTIKAKFFWSSATGSTAGDTCEWEIQGGAVTDSDAIDTALGTGQVISDTLLADNGGDMQLTSATPAITIGGTPAAGDLLVFKVSRNVGGTDNMTENAWLFGVWVQYKATLTVAAW